VSPTSTDGHCWRCIAARAQSSIDFCCVRPIRPHSSTRRPHAQTHRQRGRPTQTSLQPDVTSCRRLNGAIFRPAEQTTLRPLASLLFYCSDSTGSTCCGIVVQYIRSKLNQWSLIAGSTLVEQRHRLYTVIICQLVKVKENIWQFVLEAPPAIREPACYRGPMGSHSYLPPAEAVSPAHTLAVVTAGTRFIHQLKMKR